MQAPKVQSGFYWHVHHNILLEWCYSYQERANYIASKKAESEREIRLRLFKPIKGNLPQEVVEAGRVYDKAWRAHDKAWRVYDKAGRAYDKARQAYDDALAKNETAIQELHAKECPDCPWNGHTIFPQAA